MRLLVAVVVGALVLVGVAIAGNARFSKTSANTFTCPGAPECTPTSASTASALAASSEATTSFTSVGVSIEFDANAVGGNDLISASATFDLIGGCVVKSNNTVPGSSINKQIGGTVSGAGVSGGNFDLQNGRIIDGRVATFAVNLVTTSLPQPNTLKCGKGQEPKVIGIEFTSATVSATSGQPATILGSQIADNPVFLDIYKIN
jgi:hypothetical protein